MLSFEEVEEKEEPGASDEFLNIFMNSLVWISLKGCAEAILVATVQICLDEAAAAAAAAEKWRCCIDCGCLLSRWERRESLFIRDTLAEGVCEAGIDEGIKLVFTGVESVLWWCERELAAAAEVVAELFFSKAWWSCCEAVEGFISEGETGRYDANPLLGAIGLLEEPVVVVDGNFPFESKYPIFSSESLFWCGTDDEDEEALGPAGELPVEDVERVPKKLPVLFSADDGFLLVFWEEEKFKGVLACGKFEEFVVVGVPA